MTAPVAVVIPCYNYGHFLGECVESVLAQTVKPKEIVVLDDGSTDNTGEVARRYAPAVRYIRKDNGGPSTARNLGIARTSAPWLLFLDADDILFPEAIETLLNLTMRFPHAGVVFGLSHRFIDATGEHVPHPAIRLATIESIPHVKHPGGICEFIGSIFSAMLRGSFIATCCALVKRDVFTECGEFDEDFMFGEDRELWLRAAVKCDFVYVRRELARVRYHSTNLIGPVHEARRLGSQKCMYEKILNTFKTMSDDDRAFVYSEIERVSYRLVRHYLGEGDTASARACLADCRKRLQMRTRMFPYYLLTLLPEPILRAARFLRSWWRKQSRV